MRKDFIYLIILIGHLKESFVDKLDHYQLIDFFSGVGRIARLAKHVGLATAAIDKNDSSSFDVNTSAGFVWLCVMLALLICCVVRTNTNLVTKPRLALCLLLQGRMDDIMLVMGVPCSTWVLTSSGSTLRSEFFPMGTPISLHVYLANKLVSRHGFVEDNFQTFPFIPLIENLSLACKLALEV